MPPRVDPSSFFQLDPESAANRAMQTRLFETRDFDELLAASAAVLQDLGYQVTESERAVGFLRGSKERSAREYGQEINRSLITFFSSFGMILGANTMYRPPVDLQQQINASMIVRPATEAVGGGGEQGRAEVRVFFYRMIWKGDGSLGDQYIQPGEQRMEMIRDPEVYQQFFARLSKAVFLEEQKI
jgi:hypothetical protein